MLQRENNMCKVQKARQLGALEKEKWGDKEAAVVKATVDMSLD